jgi:rhodanese-related sulfurtransferase
MSVQAEQAEKMMKDPAVVVVDVRTEEERKISRIPNSIHVPVSDVENRLGTFQKENTYITYCKEGERGKTAA